MNKHFFIVVLLLLFNSFLMPNKVNAQHDLKKFKKGVFIMKKKDGGQTIIRRKGDYQIEEVGDIVVRLKITWLDDHTYRLSFVEGNDVYMRRKRKGQGVEDVIVEILEVRGDTYKQRAGIEYTPNVPVNYTFQSEITRVRKLFPKTRKLHKALPK